jgi:predicted metal-dependent hydrolase
MNIERRHMEVGGVAIEVRRKEIKNLHVGVYPPDGKVRVSAPLRLDEEAIRLAIVSRLNWIRRKQRGFREQVRESSREMVTGESHYFQGRRYRLNLITRSGRTRIRIGNNSTLEMTLPPEMDAVGRRRILDRWYRRQLYDQLPELLRKWQSVIGVSVAESRIKRMKTLWGSCNTEACRIWLNLELAKKPVGCLEYILVHEMVHLLERKHNDRFRNLMDQFLPDWRLRQDELNNAPLAHEDWSY